MKKPGKLLLIFLIAFFVCLQSGANLPAENRGQILVFVSASMPKTSLVQWLQQTQAIEAPLIIRGLVQNSLPATKDWVSNLIAENHNQGGIQINPVAFERFAIQEVPAVVAVAPAFPCPVGMQCAKPDFNVVYGNGSLTQALKTLAEQGDAAAAVAQKSLVLLRENRAQ